MRARGPRPEGTDGRDHAFRMTVESRYRRLPELKKRLKLLAYISVMVWVILTVLQTLPFWHNMQPFWQEGSRDQLSLAVQAVTGGAIWTFALYWFGTGGNFRREDSPLLLKAYVGSNILIAFTVVVLTYLQRMGEPGLRRKLPNKGMDIAELVLYFAGVIATLASAYVAATYLSVRSKTKGK